MAEPYSPTGASSTGTAYGSNQTANYQMTSPYAMEALGKAQAAASTPYQAFTTGAGGEAGASSARVASMNPMETNAYTGIASMGFQNPMQQGMDLTQQASGQFGLPAAQQYMDPYQQQVVEQQKKAAIQDYARSLPGQTAAAYQAGAGRGTRAALVQAEGQRNLQNNLQDIQAKGSQSAYENAQQQYNADMARKMTGAGQLYNQGTDIYGKQIAGGQAQQQNKQQQLTAMYEDFLKEQGYPKEQVSYLMQMLGQVPQYADYASKAYQTEAPINTQTTTAGGIEALLNSLLGGKKPAQAPAQAQAPAPAQAPAQAPATNNGG